MIRRVLILIVSYGQLLPSGVDVLLKLTSVKKKLATIQKGCIMGATCDAGIAQLVEHNLAMVRVADSSSVSRSRKILHFLPPKFSV